jgi:hypothetical protein
MLDLIHVAAIAAHQRRESWALGVYRLVDRLRQAIGDSSDETQLPHPLELPSQILDEVVHGVLKWASVEPLGGDPVGLDALAAVADERRMPWLKVVEATWASWSQAECPKTGLLTSPTSARLWNALPPELLRQLLTGHGGLAVPYRWLGEHHWAVLVAEAAEAHRPELIASVPWLMAPDRDLWDLLTSRVRLPRETLAHLWRRGGAQTAAELARRLSEGSPVAVELLTACPPEKVATATAHLSAELVLNLATPVRNTVRRWLCAQLHTRTAGWPASFRLLGDVEQALRTLPPGQKPLKLNRQGPS